MGYATLDDILKLIPSDILIQLTDDENTGAVVQAGIDEAVAQADAEIDSYCALKYTIPFTPVPVVIRKLSVDIAIYNLYSRRVEIVPQTRADRYKNAIATLQGIVKGTVKLDTDPLDDPPANVDEYPVNTLTADDRTFSKDTLGNF